MNNTFPNRIHLGKGIGQYRIATTLVEYFINQESRSVLNHVRRKDTQPQ